MWSGGFLHFFSQWGEGRTEIFGTGGGGERGRDEGGEGGRHYRKLPPVPGYAHFYRVVFVVERRCCLLSSFLLRAELIFNFIVRRVCGRVPTSARDRKAPVGLFRGDRCGLSCLFDSFRLDVFVF